MNMQFSTTDDFESFKKYISSKLSGRKKRAIDYPEYKKSSVMILFIEKNGSPHVILTLRTDRVSTHKGQVSFPGGGYDSSDKNFLDTALRETMEEIGVAPDMVEVLGEFDEYISIMGFHVYVYVGALNSIPQYTISRDEIDRMIEAPFSLFYDEKYYKCEKLTHNGRDFDVYYYEYDSITIWGMTARILTDFARKIFREKE